MDNGFHFDCSSQLKCILNNFIRHCAHFIQVNEEVLEEIRHDDGKFCSSIEGFSHLIMVENGKHCQAQGNYYNCIFLPSITFIDEGRTFKRTAELVSTSLL